MDDLFSKLAISGASVIGKAAFGYATRLAVQRISDYVDSPELKTLLAKKPATAAAAGSAVKRSKSPHGVAAHAAADADADAAEGPVDAAAAADAATLARLQARLAMKLAIVTPAIDLCDSIAAHGGHPAIAAVLAEADGVRRDLDRLGHDSSDAYVDAMAAAAVPSAPRHLNAEMQAVLDRLEALVPYLQLALQASDAHVTDRLPAGIAPSRLLRASAFLVDAARAFDRVPAARGPFRVPLAGVVGRDALLAVPVGPRFPVKLYALFHGSRRRHGPDWTWQEKFPRAIAQVVRLSQPPPALGPADADDDAAAAVKRTPPKEYDYALWILQDLDDGFVHDTDDGNDTDVAADGSTAGAVLAPRYRRHISLADVARLFYTSSGQLLRIPDSTRPVLVIKTQAPPSTSTASAPTTPATASAAAAVDWLALELLAPDDAVPVVVTDDDASEDSFDSAASDHDDDGAGDGGDEKGRPPRSAAPTAAKPTASPPPASEAAVAAAASKLDDLTPATWRAMVGDAGDASVYDSVTDPSSEARAQGADWTTPAAVSAATRRRLPLSALALLEYVLRLASIEQREQRAHLSLSDASLNLHLINDAAGHGDASAAAASATAASATAASAVLRPRRNPQSPSEQASPSVR
ncbi:hypothetical protein CXG81DRAFT_28411 [Caulochytrium protostelioides]|uniref:Ran-binding-domain-containing protein n=1 Tax=Caulochytrium protostelioides TaxID=1555241 RepID=A0A4P9X146_9FUNG|nr:hypothetical protein CXG81DRAFT_28411 [Caulochytrium protostelioides]|eukprot:RKO98792.1 hypothetical protein CXG81DRAFT_28411 [Caulochytrium protostelioides]